MFFYKNNNLVFEQEGKEFSIQEIATAHNKPFYLYDLQALRKWYRFFKKSVPQLKVFVAIKANSNQEVLKAFQEEGAGVDVVSGGEIQQALSAGFSPKQIVFSGVGKSWEELEHSVKQELFQINVESLEELKRLAKISQNQNKACQIGLRINPNVDFESHPYIKTGLTGHKFGFEEEELAELLTFIRSQKLLQLKGLSMHLGSQIFELDPLFKAIEHLKGLYIDVKKQGFPLEVMDIGGGLGVNYQNENPEEEKTRIKDFGHGLQKLLKDFDGTVIAEPGRLLLARFGILCAKVEYIKKSPTKNFVILNSGMNHFLRPALYKAKHRILPLKKSSGKLINYDVVGPICETGDTFITDDPLPEKLKSGDWLAVADTGAYGFVMANQYNSHPLPEQISYDKGQRRK